jgi:DNA-binding XRE family transcriptional regulator
MMITTNERIKQPRAENNRTQSEQAEKIGFLYV